MARLLRVQHWVACLEAHVEPPASVNNFYNLLRAGYVHSAPADAEFPWSLPRLDLFARFVGGRGTTEFEVRVAWLDAPEGIRRVGTYGPLRVAFRRGETVRDSVFRFRNVPVEGPGRYRVQLRSVKPRRKYPLATEYLTVVQRS
jgi:hypothetical protein